MQWTTNLIKSCKAPERRWFGREAGVAEAERRWVKAEMNPFELSFNRSLKVDFQGSRVTSDDGLVIVRELDERLGIKRKFRLRSSGAVCNMWIVA
jgi:hypothetical protein